MDWTHKGKGKVFYFQEPPSGESTNTECGVNYQLLAESTEAAQWELMVPVNHNQQRTMVSETVYPIDWSHSPPSWAVPPERLVHIVLISATSAFEATTLPMWPLRVYLLINNIKRFDNYYMVRRVSKA